MLSDELETEKQEVERLRKELENVKIEQSTMVAAAAVATHVQVGTSTYLIYTFSHDKLIICSLRCFCSNRFLKKEKNKKMIKKKKKERKKKKKKKC